MGVSVKRPARIETHPDSAARIARAEVSPEQVITAAAEMWGARSDTASGRRGFECRTAIESRRPQPRDVSVVVPVPE
jgi:hypothetical protein